MWVNRENRGKNLLNEGAEGNLPGGNPFTLRRTTAGSINGPLHDSGDAPTPLDRIGKRSELEGSPILLK